MAELTLFLPVSGLVQGASQLTLSSHWPASESSSTALAVAQCPLASWHFAAAWQEEESVSHVPGLARPAAGAPVRGRGALLRNTEVKGQRASPVHWVHREP